MINHINFLSAITILIMACSCGNTEKKSIDLKAEKTSKRKTSTEIKYADDIKLKKQMKKTQPAHVEDLEAWMPKILGGLSLERTKSLSIFGEVAMMGWYKKEKEKMITLAITDVAGPKGEMAASKINQYGMESESDIGNLQTRSVKVKGRMARQDYQTDKNFTNIIFFHKKRFMIKIGAHDHNVEETWKLVDELDFEALDNLIK